MVTVSIIEDCNIISTLYTHILQKVDNITEINNYESCKDFIEHRLDKNIFDDVLIIDHGQEEMSGSDLIKYMDKNKLIKNNVNIFIIT